MVKSLDVDQVEGTSGATKSYQMAKSKTFMCFGPFVLLATRGLSAHIAASSLQSNSLSRGGDAGVYFSRREEKRSINTASATVLKL